MLPSIEQAFEHRRVEDHDRFMEQYQKYVEQQRALHKKMVADRDRLSRMKVNTPVRCALNYS